MAHSCLPSPAHPRDAVLPRHLALVGPTASGKTALALALAARRPEVVEMVSVDSMAVYVGMDVGTAKPSRAERVGVAWHLIDLADPSEDFSVSRFQAQARRAIAAIESRGKVALLVGGTGLYLQAVVDDLNLPGRWPELAAALEEEAVAALYERLAQLDPLAASRMEPTNRRRVVRALEVTLGSGRPFSSFGPGLGAYPPSRFGLVGLSLAGSLLGACIDARLDAQMAAGFLDEVRGLATRPGGLSRAARQAVGYRELLAHVESGMGLDEALALVRQRSHRLARRQRAWFGRDPRVTWLDGQDPSALDALEGRLDVVLEGTRRPLV